MSPEATGKLNIKSQGRSHDSLASRLASRSNVASFHKHLAQEKARWFDIWL